MADDDPKPTDVAGTPLHYMARADSPLVMMIGCSNCTATHCIVSVVVPGFHFPCPACSQKVEKGCVISCANCSSSACAHCVYATYLKQRATRLTTS